MPRTPVRRVGRESASLQAVVPWCSSCNRLMGEMVRCAGEVNYFRYYKKLGPIAKLATSYGADGAEGCRHRRASGQSALHRLSEQLSSAQGLCACVRQSYAERICAG